jgi:hypothetical protein
MEQGTSLEADNRLVNREIPLLLWKTKGYYRVRRGPPPVPSPGQTNPVRFPYDPFYKKYYNTKCINYYSACTMGDKITAQRPPTYEHQTGRLSGE